jgi:hypothetical protein
VQRVMALTGLESGLPSRDDREMPQA